MIEQILSCLAGRSLPDGCGDCTAEQILSADTEIPGVWRLLIIHDDTCPIWRNIQQGRAS